MLQKDIQCGPLHVQAELSTVERLDLVPIVNAEDQCLVQRIRVEPDQSVSSAAKFLSRETLNVSTRCGLRARSPDPLNAAAATRGRPRHLLEPSVAAAIERGRPQLDPLLTEAMLLDAGAEQRVDRRASAVRGKSETRPHGPSPGRRRP
jgi:hypothetical protein